MIESGKEKHGNYNISLHEKNKISLDEYQNLKMNNSLH